MKAYLLSPERVGEVGVWQLFLLCRVCWGSLSLPWRYMEHTRVQILSPLGFLWMAILAVGVFVWFVTIVLSWLKLWTRKRSARALGFQSWWNDYRALQRRTLFPTAGRIRRAGAQPDGIAVSKAILRKPLHPVQEGDLDPWQRGKCLNVHVMLQWC